MLNKTHFANYSLLQESHIHFTPFCHLVVNRLIQRYGNKKIDM